MNKGDKDSKSRKIGPAIPTRAEAPIDWDQAAVGRFCATGKQLVVQLSERAAGEFRSIVNELARSLVHRWAHAEGGTPEKSAGPLRPDFLSIFILYYVRGLSAAEIARLNNMHVKTVEDILIFMAAMVKRAISQV